MVKATPPSKVRFLLRRQQCWRLALEHCWRAGRADGSALLEAELSESGPTFYDG